MQIRLMTPVGTAVHLLDADAERAEEMRAILEEQGYAVTAVSGDAAGLMDAAADILVINCESVDDALLDGVRAATAAQPRPVVVLSEDGRSETIHAAVAAGVNAYVVVGVNGNRMRSAIDLARANFQNTSGLREELDEARNALRERKIIERAKGLVMKEKRIDEDEAYALLRKRAMQKGLRLVDIATMVTEAAEVMQG